MWILQILFKLEQFSHRNCIFQEPVLFSGTMRKNLDPFDEYSDETLLKALNNVELLKAEEGVGKNSV